MPLRGVLDEVDRVVELVRELQDVLAVDRRVEDAVGGDEDLAGDGIGLGFYGADCGHLRLHRAGTVEHVLQLA